MSSKPLTAPRVYNPLVDFHLHPTSNAMVFSDHRVYACDMPMICGVSNRRGLVMWRKVWKRKRERK